MAVFELVEPAGIASLSSTAPDVFGVWETTPSEPARPEEMGSLSFAPGASPELAPDVPVWRANLPANLEQARSYLASGQARLEASRRALPTAQERLDSLAERSRSAHQDQMNVSFALDSLSTAPAYAPSILLLASLHAGADEAEAEFLDALIQIEREAREAPQKQGAAPRAGVSFGLGDSLAEGWERFQEQVQVFIHHLLQSVAAYVRVETEIAGVLVAQTSVGWTGNVRTVWQTGTPTEHIALHHCTLRLALSSRDTLFRSIAIAVQGIIKLSFLLSTPGGVVLALPSVWHYLNRMLSQAAGEAGEH
ncbi:MAG: hypothetical protein HC884_16880 [Chloroflexaceae bacterium]|nr:hypothetical protein [Chloroflexaceae bacterium]